jgi:hypothetical protein
MTDKNVKQILINPELFSLNKKRKYNNQTVKRNKSPTSENKTVSRGPRNNILKHIQTIYNKDKKEKKRNILRNLFNDNDDSNESSSNRNELNDSIDYLLKISDEPTTDEPITTTTINHTPLTIVPQFQTPPLTILQPEFPISINSPLSSEGKTPHYGCMKNGSLPTFEKYKKMLKNPRVINSDFVVPTKPETITVQPIINISNSLSKNENGLHKFLHIAENVKGGVGDGDGDGDVIDDQKVNKKRVRKRKILRRTFKLGKSKKEPKVSVLISNKTIRNKISNKMKEINQMAIMDVKQFLIKKGLIRVGSTAPNDILREMYKNVVMLCGDLQNHNSENILYNYIYSNGNAVNSK